MITKIEGPCAYEGCDQPATHIASGRSSYHLPETGHPFVACYCLTHANMIADESCPEYTDQCPNCGCRFGVN